MKRISLLCLVATVAACDKYPGESSYTDLPTQKDGKPGATVCGLAGTRGKVGFSYVDCAAHPTISGTPFGQTLAAGASVTIYIDSPDAQITSATSANPNVATVTLHRPPEVNGVYLAVATLNPGATRITLRTGYNGSGDIVDETTIGVMEATNLAVSGLPKATAFGLMEFSPLEFCAQPKRDLNALVGSNLVQATTDEGLSVSPNDSGCLLGGDTVTSGQGFILWSYVSEPQTLKVSIPGVEQSFEVSSVGERDLSDVVFDPPALNLNSKSGLVDLSVTVLAGSLPVVGVNCAMTAPGMADLSWLQPNSLFVDPAVITPDVAHYTVVSSRVTPGQYELICSLDNGRIKKSLPITVQ